MTRLPTDVAGKALLDVFTARNIRKVHQHVNDYSVDETDRYRNAPRNWETTLVHNASTTTLQLFQPVWVLFEKFTISQMVDPEPGIDNFPLTVIDEKPTGNGPYSMMLMGDWCGFDELAPGIMRGTFWCRIYEPADLDWCYRCGFDSNHKDRPTVIPEGPVHILWKEPGTETTNGKWALCQMGPPENITLKGKADGQIPHGDVGQVTVYLDQGASSGYSIPGVHLDWMHSSQAISDQKEVLVTYFPNEGKWRVVGAECEGS